MTRMLGVLLAGCAMGATPPLAAQGRATSTESGVAKSEAAELARLIYPEALNSAIVSYTILHIVSPGYHAAPDLRALEAEHSGIIDAMIAAMRPEFERGRRQALPQLWAQTSAVYAAGLTRDELRQAVAFYASPAGQRLALAERTAVAHAETKNNQVGAQKDPAEGVDPFDARARSVFEASETGRKLAALQPQIEAILNDWNSTRTPEADARVGEAMSKAAARFYDPTDTPIRLTPMSELKPSYREPTK
jgi:hypothetical protein